MLNYAFVTAKIGKHRERRIYQFHLMSQQATKKSIVQVARILIVSEIFEFRELEFSIAKFTILVCDRILRKLF